MAVGQADIDALNADLAAITREEEEAERRQRALEAATGPNLSHGDALDNARAAQRLGIDRDEVPVTPLAREEARRGQLNDALSSGRNIEEWLAERRSNAALAGPDFDTLIQAEIDWRAAAQERLRGDWVGPQDRQYLDAMRRQQQDGERRAYEIANRLSTAEGRQQALQQAERDARQLGQDLSSPAWWARQQQAVSRSASRAWEATQQFVEGLPDAYRDAQVQYQVGLGVQEEADIGWRIMNGAELPGDRARLAELRGLHRPMPETWIGPAAQSLPMTWRGFVASIKGGLETGFYGAAAGATLAGVAGQAGPQVAAPEELVTMPAGAVAGFSTTFGVGAMLGGGSEMMRTEAGLAYVEFTDPSFVDEAGRPLDPEIARRAALLVGVINGGLEVVSLRALLRQLPGGSELLAGGTRAAVRERMRNLLRQRNMREALGRFGRGVLEVGITEGVTEYAQESVTVQGMRLAAGADQGATGNFPLPSHEEGFARALQGGWFGFQAGTTLGGAGAGVRLVGVDIPRVFQTQRDQQHLEMLAAHMEALELRRAGVPNVVSEVAERITRDGPPEVYVDSRAFFQFFQEQDIDPREVADAIPGVGREALDDAMEAGSALAIPTSSIASHVMGTPAWDVLKDHARLTPEGFSPYELRQLQANEPELMREVNAIVKRQERAGEQAEVQQMIEQAMLRSLNEAGVTIPEANRISVRLFATMIMNAAKAGNRNPIELYEAFWQDIRGPFEDAAGRAPGPGQIAQEGPGDIAAEALRIREAHGLDDLRLTLDEGRGEIVLDLIVVPKRGRNKGAGARAMRDVLAYADRHGLRVVATPAKRGGGIGTRSRGDVVRFFRSLGFVENKGDARDPDITQPMYRPARGNLAMRQEQGATRKRFDARAVDPEEASVGRSPIPAPGTADFAALLEAALDKQDAGERLNALEEWVIRRAARSDGAISLSAGPIYQEDGPVRAGPLPPRRPHVGRVAIPAASPTDRQLRPDHQGPAAPQMAPEQAARLRQLIAERDRLTREIEDRMANERDLPEMVEARKDAEAMRGLAYCAARGMIRKATAQAAGAAAVGSTLAALGAAGITAPSEVADGTLPPGAVVTPPADRTATRAPSAVVSIPPAEPAPVQLPTAAPEEAIAALTADQAAEAVVPETLSQASAREAVDDPGAPIITNNRAKSKPQQKSGRDT